MVKSAERKTLDQESQGIIYRGASVNQLAQMFRMNREDVMRRLGDLTPVGRGQQDNPIYNVPQAAARLIRIPVTPEQIDAYMLRVNHAHLPPMVSKAYWEGKTARERYLERANELWHTEDVIRVAAGTFQSLRMSLVLIPDILRDESDLNDRQVQAVQKIIDAALEAARAQLITDLAKPDLLRSGPSEEDGPL